MKDVIIEGVTYKGVVNEVTKQTIRDLGLTDDTSTQVVFQRSVMPTDPEEGDEATVEGIDMIVSYVRGGGSAVTVYFKHDDSDG